MVMWSFHRSDIEAESGAGSEQALYRLFRNSGLGISDQFCKPGLAFLIDCMDFLIGGSLPLFQDLRIGRLLQPTEDLDNCSVIN
jgi:hypothetical protein